MTHRSEHVGNMRVSSALWAGQYIADHYIAGQQIQISTLWGSVKTCRYGAVIFRACGWGVLTMGMTYEHIRKVP